MRNITPFLFKIIVVFAIISLTYLVFVVYPKIKEVKLANLNYQNLVQNRVAYVELIKLNPEDPSYQSQKIDLIAKIKETNEKGLKSERQDVKEIMQTQKEILNDLFKAKTYEEGIKILKSEKSVKMLTNQTNLLNQLLQKLNQ